MTEPATCPRCSGPLSRTTHGLCPRCLASGALDPSSLTPSGNAGPLPSPDELGALLPGITVESLIGRGGMGAVYRGHQTSLDRPVAIKLLTAPDTANPEFAERFKLEAQTLAKLRHPNIVTVYDHGEIDGFFYILMQLVDGTDLSQLIAENQLDADQSLHLATQVATALAYAHDQGVIHRDVKPANILVDDHGNAHLADFGLAKFTGAEHQGLLTAGHQRLGTPFYMAPEQRTLGSEIDPRTDIFALGVVLYESLTGQLPSGRFPRPSEVSPKTVSSRIDPVVLKAVESDPARRYQTAGELHDAIVRSGQPRLLRPPVFIAAAVALTAIASWLVFDSARPLPDKTPIVIAGGGVLFDDRFDNKDIIKNDHAGWTMIQVGKAVAVESAEPGGGVRWTSGGSPWGFASLRCKNAFAIPEDGSLTFTWELSDLSADMHGDFIYTTQLSLLPATVDPAETHDLEKFLHFSDTDHPAIAVRLNLYSSEQGVNVALCYKDGSGQGKNSAHAHGNYFSTNTESDDGWHSTASARHSVWLRIDQHGISAGWSGGPESGRVAWGDTTFSPQSPEAFGNAVWPLLFAQNGESDQSGTHTTHRLTVEASTPGGR